MLYWNHYYAAMTNTKSINNSWISLYTTLHLPRQPTNKQTFVVVHSTICASSKQTYTQDHKNSSIGVHTGETNSSHMDI